jgi:hypothetical protein
MILKEKYNDIALRSLGEKFDDIQTQILKSNFGFIFLSSYTINPYVQLTSLRGNPTLLEAFRRISDKMITFFLLPPPARFPGNYRSLHARNALELIKTGALVWFDRVVHSKFLLFWSFNHRQFIEHRRYYGSTNFTRGGLVTNIEEFYHNRRGWRYSVNPSRSHAFLLRYALKRVDEIIKLYESFNYWAKNLGDLQDKIPKILSDLKQKALTAKELIEKLKFSMLSYSYILDMLSDLWNLPGKQFAYNECEKLLLVIDDYSGFNLEFLEELLVWPNEILMEFIKQWKIDVERYLEIPNKVIQSLSILREDLERYRKKGYEAYIFHEEKELMERIKSEQSREALLILRKLMRSNGK